MILGPTTPCPCESALLAGPFLLGPSTPLGRCNPGSAFCAHVALLLRSTRSRPAVALTDQQGTGLSKAGEIVVNLGKNFVDVHAKQCSRLPGLLHLDDTSVFPLTTKVSCRFKHESVMAAFQERTAYSVHIVAAELDADIIFLLRRNRSGPKLLKLSTGKLNQMNMPKS